MIALLIVSQVENTAVGNKVQTDVVGCLLLCL